MSQLIQNEDIQRMPSFVSYAFALWAPRLHNHYVENNAKLRARCPDLRRLFPNSVFSCAAFNFGVNVWSFKHRDMVVEFPAGALILVPSAAIAHSNIPVQDGDERVSFTQFTAGDKKVAEDGPEEYVRLLEFRQGRWERGLQLFSTVEEMFCTTHIKT
ncbi:hypothetical protein R3P38DRAFT_3331378 [Favolaschia claudopus]|uniref:Uncharacterized protein n=1 Tax=Favolaschia claudopus TaxID=2862362 RepID=A0AAV9ZTQ0_9AGAR